MPLFEMIFPSNLNSSQIFAFFSKKLPLNFAFEDFKIKDFAIFFPQQIHSNKVIEVKEPSLFKVKADGGFTSKPGLLLCVRTADCLPILFKTQTEKGTVIVGAIHAGWRGTLKKILFNALHQVSHLKKIIPEKTYLAFGPHIRPCCYEVKKDVISLLERHFDKNQFVEKRENRYFLDLLKLNLYQLKPFNIPKENIWISKDCTCCNHQEYWSHRKHKDRRNFQISGIGIRVC